MISERARLSFYAMPRQSQPEVHVASRPCKGIAGATGLHSLSSSKSCSEHSSTSVVIRVLAGNRWPAQTALFGESLIKLLKGAGKKVIMWEEPLSSLGWGGQWEESEEQGCLVGTVTAFGGGHRSEAPHLTLFFWWPVQVPSQWLNLTRSQRQRTHLQWSKPSQKWWREDLEE